MTYILSTAKLDATGHWWVASLANYNFSLHYKSGKQNIEVDALSCIDWGQEDPVIVKAAILRGISNDSSIPMYLLNEPVIVKNMQVYTEPKITKDEWLTQQLGDPDIGLVLHLVKQNKHLQYKFQVLDTPGMKMILKYRQDLVLKNGLLYRKVQLRNRENVMFQFVLPKEHHK